MKNLKKLEILDSRLPIDFVNEHFGGFISLRRYDFIFDFFNLTKPAKCKYLSLTENREIQKKIEEVKKELTEDKSEEFIKKKHLENLEKKLNELLLFKYRVSKSTPLKTENEFLKYHEIANEQIAETSEFFLAELMDKFEETLEIVTKIYNDEGIYDKFVFKTQSVRFQYIGLFFYLTKLFWIISKINTIMGKPIFQPKLKKSRRGEIAEGETKTTIKDKDFIETITKHDKFFIMYNSESLETRESTYFTDLDKNYDGTVIPREMYDFSVYFTNHFYLKESNDQQFLMWGENVKIVKVEFEKIKKIFGDNPDDSISTNPIKKRSVNNNSPINEFTLNPGFYSFKKLSTLFPNLKIDSEKAKFYFDQSIGIETIPDHLKALLIDPDDGRPNILGDYSSIGIHLEELASNCSITFNKHCKKIYNRKLYTVDIKPDCNGKFFGVRQSGTIENPVYISLANGNHRFFNFWFTDANGRKIENVPSAIKLDLYIA